MEGCLNKGLLYRGKNSGVWRSYWLSLYLSIDWRRKITKKKSIKVGYSDKLKNIVLDGKPRRNRLLIVSCRFFSPPNCSWLVIFICSERGIYLLLGTRFLEYQVCFVFLCVLLFFLCFNLKDFIHFPFSCSTVDSFVD